MGGEIIKKAKIGLFLIMVFNIKYINSNLKLKLKEYNINNYIYIMAEFFSVLLGSSIFLSKKGKYSSLILQI